MNWIVLLGEVPPWVIGTSILLSFPALVGLLTYFAIYRPSQQKSRKMQAKAKDLGPVLCPRCKHEGETIVKTESNGFSESFFLVCSKCENPDWVKDK